VADETGSDPSDWSATSTTFTPADFHTAPYLGNGRIGSTIPPSGAGYQGYDDAARGTFPLWQPRYTGTFLAGFYARQTGSYNNTQVIAALPAWSGLAVTVGDRTYQPDVDPSTVSNYRQTLNYRDATVTTRATWSPGTERQLDLTYRTFVSRSQPNLAVQRLTVIPQFSGELAVTDLIDGAAARRVTPVASAADPTSRQSTVGVRAEGTDNTAFVVSTVDTPDETTGTTAIAPGGGTAGLRFSVAVEAGHSYTFTKYVGIASTDDGTDPQAIATAAAGTARAQGFDTDHADHGRAWQQLWQPALEIPGRDDYRDWIRAAWYSVLSSVREGQRWSVQPAGLSSDDYAGLTFWDAETWIFPTLLALYPELARTIVDMRAEALPQALANARIHGMQGALFPWDDGPAQRCATLVVCGLGEEHLSNEIVLAQWQYYLATGDEQWLRHSGVPVITAIADYLTARIGPKLPDGKYHLAPVGGADEYVAISIDNALTNGGVINTMRTATAAARIAGAPVDPRWADIAAGMAMPGDITPGVPAEYRGYTGQQIKQADTVLLSYPFSYVRPGYSPVATLQYYFDRTDPYGPNMSNSVAAILTAEHDPCRTQYYLDQSAIPYAQGPYHFQAEHRGVKTSDNAVVQSLSNLLTQPAWIFVTGAAGFLQGLIYGPTGFRWTEAGPHLDPMLPSGFPDGMTIRDIAIRGSRLTIQIQPATTTVSLTAGPPITLDTPNGPQTVTSDTPLHLTTRRACS
jgi:trehalose/maltose hydrolase-like predicted phosphorylase